MNIWWHVLCGAFMLSASKRCQVKKRYELAADLSDPVYKTKWNTLSHYDAGIVSANIYLCCAANGLATVCRGSMDRDALKKALKLGDNVTLHLNHPVGWPAGGGAVPSPRK